MNNKHLSWLQRELLQLASELIAILEKEKLWYVVDSGTMLGTIRHKGFIPWDDDFDIQINMETYNALMKKYPNRIINSNNFKNKYPLMMPKWVINPKNYLNTPIAIDLFIIVPSSKQRVKKYRSLFNQWNHGFMSVHTNWRPFDIGTRIFKIITLPVRPFKSLLWRDNKYQLKTLIEKDKPEGFFVLDNPIIKARDLWYDNFSFKTELMDFENIKVRVPIEHTELLIRKYGVNYMVPYVGKKTFYHVNAVSVKILKVKNPSLVVSEVKND